MCNYVAYNRFYKLRFFTFIYYICCAYNMYTNRSVPTKPEFIVCVNAWEEFEFSAWGLAGAHGERV